MQSAAELHCARQLPPSVQRSGAQSVVVPSGLAIVWSPSQIAPISTHAPLSSWHAWPDEHCASLVQLDGQSRPAPSQP
jgi:hypothetical protein